MIRAAARRFAILLVATAASTSVLSMLVGLLLGASAGHSASVGLYLVGCFLLVAGFFVGNRGPARLRGDEPEGGALGGMFGLGIGSRRLRGATVEEREESIANSAIFVVLGLALILFGVLADSRVRLV
jgi:uncharacterized membrane protein HdeD (DUF308 family)